MKDILIQLVSSPELTALISGVMVSGLTEAAKRVQSIPLNPNNKKAVKITAFALSGVTVLLTRLMSGTLTDQAWLTDVVNVGVGGAATWMIAHMSYNSLLKKEE